ncbi:unnamed protein product [Macrosiphum euphorbiae]|uniref:Uncharacterized protein n=1 Tax=Macrosiphum euphorbiae TaxID=13131 RepID=A0AAV0VGN0_9HEMI|nr:unnamed protein product [Macrosiphum euphorbiae]
MAIDIQTVRTTFNEKMKNILTSKRYDNNSFLSTKDYNDVIEQVKKSKMCLKTVGEAKTMKDYRVVRIGRTPYEAMFGCTARIGLMSSNLPNDEIKEVITEEDLEKITNEPITEEDVIGNEIIEIVEKNSELGT